MKKYRVYINQINQQYYDVDACDVQSAINKAKKGWREDNGPDVCSVELRDPEE